MKVPRIRRLAWGILVGALGSAGCNDAPPRIAPATPVAVLDGNPVALEEFEHYADAILSFDDELEPLDDEDLGRVRSRLFDAFIEEEILLLEAHRRGIRIEDEDLDAYLGGVEPGAEGPPAAERDRRMARRNLMIQKLRGAVVVVDSKVSPEAVDAYMAEHLEELEANRQIVLRSLTVGTESNAAKVRREIRAGKMAFTEAVSVFGVSPEQAQPVEVSLNDLPQSIRNAVKGLESGEISEPVEFQGSIYLFLVDVGPAKLSEERLRRQARDELTRSRSQEASDRFLSRLRSEIAIELYPEALPFEYIPE
jgi:parvulin-like peptidyl-prolyl isomerase